MVSRPGQRKPAVSGFGHTGQTISWGKHHFVSAFPESVKNMFVLAIFSPSVILSAAQLGGIRLHLVTELRAGSEPTPQPLNPIIMGSDRRSKVSLDQLCVKDLIRHIECGLSQAMCIYYTLWAKHRSPAGAINISDGSTYTPWCVVYKISWELEGKREPKPLTLQERLHPKSFKGAGQSHTKQ